MLVVDLSNKKFELGQVVMTCGVQARFEDNDEELFSYLERHMSGDWGDLDPNDKQMNEDALKQGERILSSYHLVENAGWRDKMYIITEWDRSVTTFLMAEEY
jgi:predicted small metal-binding protein